MRKEYKAISIGKGMAILKTKDGKSLDTKYGRDTYVPLGLVGYRKTIEIILAEKIISILEAPQEEFDGTMHDTYLITTESS